MLDDVKINYINTQKMLDMMDSNKLHVVSPLIHNSHYKFMSQKSSNQYNIVKFVELYLTFFSKSAWICFQKLLNLFNKKHSVGWGYDICFPSFCGEYSRAIIPMYYVIHKDSKPRKCLTSRRGIYEIRHLEKVVKKISNKNCIKHKQFLKKSNMTCVKN